MGERITVATQPDMLATNFDERLPAQVLGQLGNVGLKLWHDATPDKKWCAHH
jgi:hypothetical protein